MKKGPLQSPFRKEENSMKKGMKNLGHEFQDSENITRNVEFSSTNSVFNRKGK